MRCKTCQEDLKEEKFYYRKDTKKYHLNCKKCMNKKTWQRHKNGIVKKRTEFNFICKECKVQRSSADFYLKDKKRNRYDTTCQKCRKTGAKKWHQENREISLKNKKNWHKENRETNLKRFRENYQKRMEENPKKEYEDRKRWRLENTEKINVRTRERYHTEPNFKLGSRLRGNTNRIIKKGCKKNCKTLKMLGCTIPLVREWLETQFQEDMTWENHGKLWHIDHFYPVACYNFIQPEEQNRCFHWSNLQPLYKKENLQKNCQIPSKEKQEKHRIKVQKFLEINKLEEKSITPVERGSSAG